MTLSKVRKNGIVSYVLTIPKTEVDFFDIKEGDLVSWYIEDVKKKSLIKRK